MDTDSVEINNTFSPSEFFYLKHQIENENEFRKLIYDKKIKTNNYFCNI